MPYVYGAKATPRCPSLDIPKHFTLLTWCDIFLMQVKSDMGAQVLSVYWASDTTGPVLDFFTDFCEFVQLLQDIKLVVERGVAGCLLLKLEHDQTQNTDQIWDNLRGVTPRLRNHPGSITSAIPMRERLRKLSAENNANPHLHPSPQKLRRYRATHALCFVHTRLSGVVVWEQQ